MISKTNFSDIGQIIEYMKSVPFEVNRSTLYNTNELYEGYNPEKTSRMKPVSINEYTIIIYLKAS